VTVDGRIAAVAPDAELEGGSFIGESRWPPGIALFVFMVLNISLRLWLPSDATVRVSWLLPALEAVLLAVLIGGQPASRIAHRTALRRVAVTLVIVLVAAALWSTGLLIHDLIEGTGMTGSPSKLLASGALVWLGNNLGFALLYWLVDGGGPIARTQNPVPVDFAFTQHLSPELAPVGWRPVFLDYLHLGFTNATAFSPTDVMPLTLRAKYIMLMQSTVALALFGLVVARAVNAFG
jgi:uncharacterized membrane protein